MAPADDPTSLKALLTQAIRGRDEACRAVIEESNRRRAAEFDVQFVRRVIAMMAQKIQELRSQVIALTARAAEGENAQRVREEYRRQSNRNWEDSYTKKVVDGLTVRSGNASYEALRAAQNLLTDYHLTLHSVYEGRDAARRANAELAELLLANDRNGTMKWAQGIQVEKDLVTGAARAGVLDPMEVQRLQNRINFMSGRIETLLQRNNELRKELSAAQDGEAKANKDMAKYIEAKRLFQHAIAAMSEGHQATV